MRSISSFEIDVFDSIAQEFDLEKETKEFKKTNFNPYKNIEDRISLGILLKILVWGFTRATVNPVGNFTNMSLGRE